MDKVFEVGLMSTHSRCHFQSLNIRTFLARVVIIWPKADTRHSAPTPFAATATCPLPQPVNHLLTSLLYTPTPFPSRSLTERTLHPSASPSSPSFLPSEILASVPGGLEAAGRDGKGAWREACSVILGETGRSRRVKLGWVEKEGFIEYWRSKRR
jgi:hypothetical protein